MSVRLPRHGLALQARLNLLPRRRERPKRHPPLPRPPGVSLQPSSPGGGPCGTSGFPGITGLSSLTDVKDKVQAGRPVRHALPLDLAAALLKGIWASGLSPKSPVQPTYPQARVLAPHHIQRPLPASTCLLSHCSLSPRLPPKVQSFRLRPCHCFHQKALSESRSKAS